MKSISIIGFIVNFVMIYKKFSNFYICVTNLIKKYRVQDILRRVYSFHFPEEYFKEDDYSKIEILKEISQTQFFKFCREFNIIPQMIAKGRVGSTKMFCINF